MRQTALDDLDQQLEIQRLRQEIVASEPARQQMAFATAICGDEEERNIAQLPVGFAQMPENVETGHMRHFDIAQDETRAFADFPDSLHAVASQQRLEPLLFQDLGQEFTRCGIILDAEDLRATGHVMAKADVRGSSMVTLVPRSTSLSIRRRPRCASTIRSAR